MRTNDIPSLRGQAFACNRRHVSRAKSKLDELDQLDQLDQLPQSTYAAHAIKHAELKAITRSRATRSPVVPIQARRMYVLATYLFVPGGELKALTWPDVDLERGLLSVRRSFDRAKAS